MLLKSATKNRVLSNLMRKRNVDCRLFFIDGFLKVLICSCCPGYFFSATIKECLNFKII